jgi:hypothetical protein
MTASSGPSSSSDTPSGSSNSEPEFKFLLDPTNTVRTASKVRLNLSFRCRLIARRVAHRYCTQVLVDQKNRDGQIHPPGGHHHDDRCLHFRQQCRSSEGYQGAHQDYHASDTVSNGVRILQVHYRIRQAKELLLVVAETPIIISDEHIQGFEWQNTCSLI